MSSSQWQTMNSTYGAPDARGGGLDSFRGPSRAPVTRHLQDVQQQELLMTTKLPRAPEHSEQVRTLKEVSAAGSTHHAARDRIARKGNHHRDKHHHHHQQKENHSVAIGDQARQPGAMGVAVAPYKEPLLPGGPAVQKHIQKLAVEKARGTRKLTKDELEAWRKPDDKQIRVLGRRTESEAPDTYLLSEYRSQMCHMQAKIPRQLSYIDPPEDPAGPSAVPVPALNIAQAALILATKEAQQATERNEKETKQRLDEQTQTWRHHNSRKAHSNRVHSSRSNVSSCSSSSRHMNMSRRQQAWVGEEEGGGEEDEDSLCQSSVRDDSSVVYQSRSPSPVRSRRPMHSRAAVEGSGYESDESSDASLFLPVDLHNHSHQQHNHHNSDRLPAHRHPYHKRQHHWQREQQRHLEQEQQQQQHLQRELVDVPVIVDKAGNPLDVATLHSLQEQGLITILEPTLIGNSRYNNNHNHNNQTVTERDRVSDRLQAYDPIHNNNNNNTALRIFPQPRSRLPVSSFSSNPTTNASSAYQQQLLQVQRQGVAPAHDYGPGRRTDTRYNLSQPSPFSYVPPQPFQRSQRPVVAAGVQGKQVVSRNGMYGGTYPPQQQPQPQEGSFDHFSRRPTSAMSSYSSQAAATGYP